MKTTKQFLIPPVAGYAINSSDSITGRLCIMRGFLIAAVACCFALTTNAQVSYGPKFGANLSNIVGTESDDNDMKFGYHIGMVVDIAVGDRFAWETGIEYSAKGTQAKEESSIKWNLNYIEIPFLAKGRFDGGFNMFAGPYLGILTSSKITDGTDDIDLKDYTASTDAGFKFGVGYQLKSGLAFSAHCAIGCVRLDKSEDAIGSTYNRVYGLSMAYMFGGK